MKNLDYIVKFVNKTFKALKKTFLKCLIDQNRLVGHSLPFLSQHCLLGVLCYTLPSLLFLKKRTHSQKEKKDIEK